MKKHFEPLLHVIFWALMALLSLSNFGIRYLFVIAPDGEEIQRVVFIWPMLYASSVDMVLKMAFFYSLAYWWLPRFIEQKSVKKAIITGLFFLGSLLATLLLAELILIYSDSPDSPRRLNLLAFMVSFHFVVFLLAYGYRLYKDQISNDRLRRQTEKESLQTELNFLKSQINPHFLFNTLNNLYAEALSSENTVLGKGIAKLSQMMRYMIYDSRVEFVPLEKEVEYLKSYVDLQLLRISPEDAFRLEMHLDEYNRSVAIAPVLFQPLVENAFKHGIELDGESYVKISLITSDRQMVFSVENSKSNDLRLSEPSGIGLENTRRRLELIYPGRHQLDIENTNDFFRVTLTIDL